MKKSVDVWYVNALEKLNPLRYHIHILITEIESHNRWAARTDMPTISVTKLQSAKEAADEAENFFTKRIVNSDSQSPAS